MVAVHLPEAAGVALHFSDFHLPAGAQLWVTNLTSTWQEGPYDFRDNDDHGRIAAWGMCPENGWFCGCRPRLT